MGRRTILLLAALVVAALGTTLVFLYVNGVRSDAHAKVNPVKVLVAKGQISAGTSGTEAQKQGLFVTKTVEADAAATGALSDVTPIANLVALAPIFDGQQIQSAMFGQQLQATNSLQLKPGQFAVSLTMGDPQRVAGFLTPGSTVAIFITYTPKTPGAGPTTRVLLSPVTVVATGNSTATTTTTTKDASGNAQTTQLPLALLTLAVDQPMAEKIATATAIGGSLQFGLLNGASKIDTNDAGINLDNLFK